MKKRSLTARLAVLLTFLILAVGTSPGQTPSQTETPTANDEGQDTTRIPPANNRPRDFKRWGLSLHSGVSIPHGDFNTLFDPGPNFGVDLEYRFSNVFSMEGIYTFHRLRGDTIGSVTVGDINLHQFSANGKVYGSSSPVHPFFNFGGGAYRFESSSTRGGLNVGGGLQFPLTPAVSLDVMYNFHNVFTSGSSTRFSTLQGGVRFRF
jgi:opacity protein-like surface antigen